MRSIQTLAIIGAGMAGCYLADRLAHAGIHVTVFEKSRGTGGRLASCRLGDTSADLGAPYFTATSEAFRHWLENQSAVVPWQEVSSAHSSVPTHYVAKPRQSALTRSLLANAQLIAATRIIDISAQTSGQQQLIDEQGVTYGPFDGVVVCAPAQQAANLLTSVPDFAARAHSVQPAMNWVVVVDIALDDHTDVNHYHMPHPIIGRAIKDSAKPGRVANIESRETWVLEAGSEWSRAHQEASPEWIFKTLIDAFSTVLTRPFNVIHQRTHRWLLSRYPNTTTTSLWSEDHSIGACGDWLSIQGVEGAWLSAQHLATRILEQTAHTD